MLKIEQKEYDINLLCSFSFDFQMLKDVLINLAKSNIKLEKKIKRLEKLNDDKNKRLTTLEERLNIFITPEENNYSDSEINENNNEDKTTKEEKLEQKEENKDNNENKEINKENEEKGVNTEKNGNEIKQDKEEGINKEKDESKKDMNQINTNEEKKEKEKNKDINIKQENSMNNTNTSSDRRRAFRDYEYRNSMAHQVPQVTHETIKSLLKLIRENSDKIGKFEKNIAKKLRKDLDNLESNFDDFSQNCRKEFKSLNEKIRNANENFCDYDAKINGLIVKTAPLDNLNIFRDSGNGNIDTTKTMIKFLEEKVNKKITILEDKSEKDKKNEELFKKKLEELEELINKINKEISNQEQKEKKDLEVKINENNEEIQNLKNSLDDKYSELLKITNEISSKMKNGELIEEQFNELLNKFKSGQKMEIPKEEENNNPKVEKENKENNIHDDYVSFFKKNLKTMNKKLNDINNNFQSLLDIKEQEISKIKKNVEEINEELEKKISKFDLKNLENKLTKNSDELFNLNDKVTEFAEGYKKLSENKAGIVERLEMLTNGLIELRNREVKVIKQDPTDFSNYVDKQYLTEFLKPINKNIEILLLDKKVISTLSNNIKQIDEKLTIYETKERVMKLEEELIEKMSDYMSDMNKKYLEKTEFNKYIKSLEIKLKSLDKEPSKENENWILAKQPIGCFNCASCEANIKNSSPPGEYLPWNKYPKGERQYNLGQGFSRLLQKINNKNNKNHNRNEMRDLLSETEIKSSMYLNNIPSLIKSNSQFFYKLQNKEINKDNNLNENNSTHSKKKSLPEVLSNRKNVEIPLTDEENVISNRSMDNQNFSPQIMKIAKKKIKGDIFEYKMKQKALFRNNINLMNITPNKSYNKLERNESLPFYENVN